MLLKSVKILKHGFFKNGWSNIYQYKIEKKNVYIKINKNKHPRDLVEYLKLLEWCVLYSVYYCDNYFRSNNSRYYIFYWVSNYDSDKKISEQAIMISLLFFLYFFFLV